MQTSQELMAAGGVDRQTLAQLQRLGVIPNPLKHTAPGGRGIRGYWPDSCLETMKAVRAYRAEGRTLEQIAARLARTIEWGRPSERSRVVLAALDQSYEIKVPGATITDTGRAFVRGHVADSLCGLGVDLAKADRIANAITADEPLGWALELFMSGWSPVVIAAGADPYIVPDFMVAHEISFGRKMVRHAHYPDRYAEDFVKHEGESASRACLVVTLSLWLDAALRRVGVTGAAPNFAYLPGEKVRRAEPDALVEQEVLTFQLPPGSAGTYGFTLRGGTSNVEIVQDLPAAADAAGKKPKRKNAPKRRSDRNPKRRGKQKN